MYYRSLVPQETVFVSVDESGTLSVHPLSAQQMGCAASVHQGEQ